MTSPSTPVALVTGCAKIDGAGGAIARALAADGYHVFVSDRAGAGATDSVSNTATSKAGWNGLSSLVDEIVGHGGRATALEGDIRDRDDARRLVAQAASPHGRLDVLVNNAAAPQGADRVDIEDVEAEDWALQIDVNLTGTFFMCQAAVPFMRARRYGRIVNVASMAGLTAAPRSAAYSASKAGVIGLTRSLSMDVGRWGITVNALCPGLIDTSRATPSIRPGEDRVEHLASRAARIPVGRVGATDDVAGAVRYLAARDSGYVTGHTLVLDGGGLSPFPLPAP